MASGSTITLSGGTTMTQVVASVDDIEAVDFNNARTNVNTMLGTAADVTLGTYTETSTYGWGQGGAGVNAVSVGDLITADATATEGYVNLQDDVQAMCAFLGQTVRSGVGTDVSVGDTVYASDWNNLMLNIKDCWDNRFSPASWTVTVDGSASRTTSWTNTLTQITTWTFSNEADCRAFFNGGGKLGVSASRTGGSSNTQNTTWTTRLTNLGDVLLKYNTTEASAGTIAGVGFYELTTSYQTLVTYYGAASPYSGDYVIIDALVNSTTNPTVITIRTRLTDTTDNSIDAAPDGTLTINAIRANPVTTGTGFTFPVPTDSAGAISGS